MQIKTTGRAALMFAAGLFALSMTSSAQALCLFDCPKTEQSAEKTEAAKDEAKPVTIRKYKRYHKSRYTLRREKAREAARRERAEKAEKARVEKAAEARKVADAEADKPVDAIKVPDAVANANALLVGNIPKAPSAIDAYADTQKHGLLHLVSADELNEIDKTAGQPETMPAKVTPAVADSRAEMTAEQSSTWDNTSVIGRIFIAFGTLLTLFSAARMFMA